MTGLEENVEELTKKKYRDSTVIVDDTELRILQGLSEGKGFVQIGACLNISEVAASGIARRFYKRIRVHNATHAVAWAFLHGYLRTDVPVRPGHKRVKDPMQTLYDGYVVGV